MNKLSPTLLSMAVIGLLGCAGIQPVELPQAPYSYDKSVSAAKHYSNAMGLTEVVDLPEGEADKMLQVRKKTALENGVTSSLTGYVISFGLAKSLGFPTSSAKDLAGDHVDNDFIMGASSGEKYTKAIHVDNTAVYLPFELASDKESARKYVFDYYVDLLNSMGLNLKELELEYEYGTGHEFIHPLCIELNVSCRYKIRVREPVIAYAPELLGGYKAWVWSPASANWFNIEAYHIESWGSILSIDTNAWAENEKRIQDTFQKPLTAGAPEWLVQYKAPTYTEAPKVIVKGNEYKFIQPL